MEREAARRMREAKRRREESASERPQRTLKVTTRRKGRKEQPASSSMTTQDKGSSGEKEGESMSRPPEEEDGATSSRREEVTTKDNPDPSSSSCPIRRSARIRGIQPTLSLTESTPSEVTDSTQESIPERNPSSNSETTFPQDSIPTDDPLSSKESASNLRKLMPRGAAISTDQANDASSTSSSDQTTQLSSPSTLQLPRNPEPYKRTRGDFEHSDPPPDAECHDLSERLRQTTLNTLIKETYRVEFKKRPEINYLGAQGPSPPISTRDLDPMYVDAILHLAIFSSPAMTHRRQELALSALQPLSAILEVLDCLSGEGVPEVSSGEDTPISEAEAPKNGAFIFIEGVFYNDTRPRIDGTIPDDMSK